jgi:hypothetical protein
LNMVRAGVVTHPSDWAHSGYREVQNPPKRHGIAAMRRFKSSKVQGSRNHSRRS